MVSMMEGDVVEDARVVEGKKGSSKRRRRRRRRRWWWR
jgi:hypothetical protein